MFNNVGHNWFQEIVEGLNDGRIKDLLVHSRSAGADLKPFFIVNEALA